MITNCNNPKMKSSDTYQAIAGTESVGSLRPYTANNHVIYTDRLVLVRIIASRGLRAECVAGM
jgi:hypothetical protein